jgi:hypothetical protein
LITIISKSVPRIKHWLLYHVCGFYCVDLQVFVFERIKTKIKYFNK